MSNLLFELIQNAWRSKNALYYLVLVPLSWLFGMLVFFRRFAYRHRLLKSHQLAVPVIVVGNINMGGSGKTPVVIWLVEQLKQLGYHPAVLSRGYGANSTLPRPVLPDSIPAAVGDEPLLISRRSGCPVWVGADRLRTGVELLKAHPACDVIVCDDGLQHYRLKRDVEIAVVDAEASQYYQNLLPAGVLREPTSRLNEVDAVIINGHTGHGLAFEMQLVGSEFYNLANPQQRATVADFKRSSVMAMAGIGHPERFFEHLRQLGLTFASVSFRDHHAYSAQEVMRIDSDVLIMTEKDAVKCRGFAQPHHWVLPVQAQIDERLMPLILAKLPQAKKD